MASALRRWIDDSILRRDSGQRAAVGYRQESKGLQESTCVLTQSQKIMYANDSEIIARLCSTAKELEQTDDVGLIRRHQLMHQLDGQFFVKPGKKSRAALDPIISTFGERHLEVAHVERYQ